MNRTNVVPCGYSGRGRVSANQSGNASAVWNSVTGATAEFRPGALNTDADDYLWLTQILISHTEHLSGPVLKALRASLRHGQVESYAEVNWV